MHTFGLLGLATVFYRCHGGDTGDSLFTVAFCPRAAARGQPLWRDMADERSQAFASLKRAKTASEVQACRASLRRMGAFRMSRDWNTLISAFSRVGAHAQALDTLQEMYRSNVRPDVYSYNSTMAALSKARSYDGALRLLDDMMAEGVMPNTITFNTAITACERCERWERAMSLLDEMRKRGVSADIITYNAALSALQKGNQTRRALELFDEMPRLGVRPDRISYNVVILACKSEGLWERALQVRPPFQTTALCSYEG